MNRREAVSAAEATFSKPYREPDKGWWTFDVTPVRATAAAIQAGGVMLSASGNRQAIVRRRRQEVVRLALVMLGWQDRAARQFAEECNAMAPLGMTMTKAREHARGLAER
jgi:hypothetical protein